MAGYWNRDRDEPFTAWCADHFPVPLTPAWRAVSERRADAPESLEAFLACHGTNGDTPEAREHWSRGMTPVGYAYTPWTVGARCEVCGEAC